MEDEVKKTRNIDTLIDGFTAMERNKQQIVAAVVITLVLLFFVVFAVSLLEKQSAAYYCGNYCTAIGQEFYSYGLGKCQCAIDYPKSLIPVVNGG